MRRYAAHVTKLVRAETQDRQHFGIDSVQRLAKPAGDQVIEFASASQATHHEFGDERALALAEAVQARRMEQCVGKRTIPLNASRQAVGRTPCRRRSHELQRYQTPAVDPVRRAGRVLGFAERRVSGCAARPLAADSGSNDLEIRIPSDPRWLQLARLVVERCCREFEIEPAAMEGIKLAVDEALSNIMRHAYHGDTERSIHIALRCEQAAFQVEICDDGQEFDPFSQSVPPPDELRAGGARYLPHSRGDGRVRIRAGARPQPHPDAQARA